MKYDQDIHHRRSIRLKGHDYSQIGAYFVTICTHSRNLYFEIYSGLKEIVISQWQALSRRYPDLTLDEFVIMPNHFHGILFVGATLAVARKDGAGARPAPTVGEIVGAYKSLCIHDWLVYIEEKKIRALGKFWQRNYYEHVIRTDDELNRIREYIRNNPLKWSLDRENPDRVGRDILEDEIFDGTT